MPSSFSGFYLPLMIVLWLLILRGISIEFRNHIQSLGVAAAVGRGFRRRQRAAGHLSSARRWATWSAACRWTRPAILPAAVDQFPAGKDAGILDWYTVLVAVCRAAGADRAWVALGCAEDGGSGGASRAPRRRKASGGALAAWVVLITLASFRIQPHLEESFAARPWGYVFPLSALAWAWSACEVLEGQRNGLGAFLSSCLFISGMLTSAAFGVYPYVLPSSSDPVRSLTIHSAAAGG